MHWSKRTKTLCWLASVAENDTTCDEELKEEEQKTGFIQTVHFCCCRLLLFSFVLFFFCMENLWYSLVSTWEDSFYLFFFSSSSVRFMCVDWTHTENMCNIIRALTHVGLLLSIQNILATTGRREEGGVVYLHSIFISFAGIFLLLLICFCSS